MEKKNKEAAIMQKKKSTINKARVKKTIKNTLCRPDPVFWPIVAEEQAKLLGDVLASHKVEIPEFKKLHWRELKSIPKDQRPKQSKLKKVEGLIFGIAECTDALKNNQCSAVIIESAVNPRVIVQPLIEASISNKVPIVCLNGLRQTASLNFGIPTCCLAIKTGFLQDLRNKIDETAKTQNVPKPLTEKNSNKVILNVESSQNKMETKHNTEQELSSVCFTYLYRINKNTRVFNPSQEESKAKKAFTGQDYIEFSNKSEQKPSNRKSYMTMILKKMTNNENRTKRK